MSRIDRRNLSTAQRLAEYVEALNARGIAVFGVTVSGREIKLDLSGSVDKPELNPADLIDP